MNSLSIVLALVFAMPAIAQEKCGRLKSTDGIAELNVVLDCLEKKLETPGRTSLGNRDMTGEIDAGRFTVMISGGTKDERFTSLKLTIRNKLAEPLRIAYDSKQNPTISDENGLSGKMQSVHGINWVNAGGNAKTLESYTTVLGNQSLTASFVFYLPNSKGKTIDLTLPLFTFNNEKPEKITVSPSFTIRQN